MKLFKNIQNRARRRNVRGFTLAEMVITVGVFLFIFTGVMVAVQIFGLRIYTLAATKLVATAGGRQAMNQIRDQIRGGKMVYVGNCSSPINSSFALIGTTNAQQGNALIIYPSTNTTWYSIYYLDFNPNPLIPYTNRLIQFNVSNSVTTYTKTLAKYVTNQIDRKSTRLNSSHLVISYAVFCLKKKKQVSLLCTVLHRPDVSSAHVSTRAHA